MARIHGVPKSKAGPMVRLVYRLGPRMMKTLTGREPQAGNGSSRSRSGPISQR